MRIFRDHDDHDHHDDDDDEQAGHSIDRSELAAQADLLADEISDFLAGNNQPANQPASGKPTLRLVPPLPTSMPTDSSATTKHAEPKGIPALTPYARGRILRASAAGSFVVVGLTTVTAWGQPAEVGAPVAVYGLGWIAYLVWNSARRPSPSLALAAFAERRAARVQRDLP